MGRLTSTENPKVEKTLQNNKDLYNDHFYVNLSHDFKAEQFVQVNALPFIISSRLHTDLTTEKTIYFEKIQSFAVLKYKGQNSKLPVNNNQKLSESQIGSNNNSKEYINNFQ